MGANPLYSNRRWNGPLAAYMALRGIAVFAVPPVVGIQLFSDNQTVALTAMLVITVVAGSVPFIRTLRAGVWIDGNMLCWRNPFRSLRVPLEDIAEITTRPLWQNFFTVAAIETYSRKRTLPLVLVPVPASDAARFAERLAAATGDPC